ncbi:MAG: DUF2721 domain-containing protein [Glaciimonas sp.]|nr:DUF2721 domain-containing protein [Glaciimonas sp.]
MNLTTPALLFPAISLLLLAYTNRFLVLAQLIRQLHNQYKKDDQKALVVRQIANLRHRITLIRRMQALGVMSFILCAVSMFLVFIQLELAAQLAFGLSLFLLLLSLIFSFYEITISTRAIEIELEDLEQKLNQPL